jgi:DNA-binding NarL/FixJ family response regulator
MNCILIADDHPLMVKSISNIIFDYFPNIKIKTAGNWEEVSANFNKCVDIFILDMEMPKGKADEQISFLRKVCPNAKIILLTSHTQSWVFHGLSKLKIEGFVSKVSDPVSIIKAINHLNDNQSYLCPEFAKVCRNKYEYPNEREHLTKREKEVLELILEAKTSKEIVKELCISENTVETHRKNLFYKFEVKNVVELVNKATSFGDTKRLLKHYID